MGNFTDMVAILLGRPRAEVQSQALVFQNRLRESAVWGLRASEASPLAVTPAGRSRQAGIPTVLPTRAYDQ